MQLLDARRLTGPNHLSRSPQVVVELAFDPREAGGLDAAIDPYASELARMRTALGLTGPLRLNIHAHLGGAVVGYEAPLDIMLACTEISEWAATSACELRAKRSALPLEPRRTELQEILARDRCPRFLALQAEAKRRDVPFFWDDDAVSIGAGSRSECWSRADLPEDVSRVPWDLLGAIPIALVTGTNGKTTSTRLVARIVREAGLRVGSTSSDEIAVGPLVIDTGDWTGPAAARVVLRRKDVDVAVLETARGGILRRGLAMDWCDAALITNVSDDHVGGYGIDDLDGMTRVKAVVTEAVRPSGTVVLNAHDAKLVALAGTIRARVPAPKVVFFADLDRDDPAARAVVASHRAQGETCVIAEGGEIRVASGSEARAIVRIDAVPITFGGVASYNVENALAATAMARALGIADDAIVRGLCGFQTSDNPRRGELVERNGVRVLLDFGHNPDGIRAVMKLVAALRGDKPGRLTVIAGAAGDRSEHDVEEVSRTIAEAKPDRVLLRDLRAYLRGRAPGEVPAMFQRALAARGFGDDAVATFDSEVLALGSAFATAKPGDFIVLLVHLDQAEVHAFLDTW
jgi:cyanophycin synthetase